MRRREVHDPVLAGAPGEHRRVALARALDEHLLDAPDARLVGGECAPLDDDAQAVEPLAGDAGSTKRSVSSAASVPGRGRRWT